MFPYIPWSDKLCESSADRINLHCTNFYHTIHYSAQNARTHIKWKSHKFIKRPILAKSHKFVTHVCKNITLQYMNTFNVPNVVSPEGYLQRLKGPDGRRVLCPSLWFLWTVRIHHESELWEIFTRRDLSSPTGVVPNNLPLLVLWAVHDNLSFVVR